MSTDLHNTSLICRTVPAAKEQTDLLLAYEGLFNSDVVARKKFAQRRWERMRKGVFCETAETIYATLNEVDFNDQANVRVLLKLIRSNYVFKALIFKDIFGDSLSLKGKDCSVGREAADKFPEEVIIDSVDRAKDSLKRKFQHDEKFAHYFFINFPQKQPIDINTLLQLLSFNNGAAIGILSNPVLCKKLFDAAEFDVAKRVELMVNALHADQSAQANNDFFTLLNLLLSDDDAESRKQFIQGLAEALAKQSISNRLVKLLMQNKNAQLEQFLRVHKDYAEMLIKPSQNDDIVNFFNAYIRLRDENKDDFLMTLLRMINKKEKMTDQLAWLIINDKQLWQQIDPMQYQGFVKRWLNQLFGWFSEHFAGVQEKISDFHPFFRAKFANDTIPAPLSLVEKIRVKLRPKKKITSQQVIPAEQLAEQQPAEQPAPVPAAAIPASELTHLEDLTSAFIPIPSRRNSQQSSTSTVFGRREKLYYHVGDAGVDFVATSSVPNTPVNWRSIRPTDGQPQAQHSPTQQSRSRRMREADVSLASTPLTARNYSSDAGASTSSTPCSSIPSTPELQRRAQIVIEEIDGQATPMRPFPFVQSLDSTPATAAVLRQTGTPVGIKMFSGTATTRLPTTPANLNHLTRTPRSALVFSPAPLVTPNRRLAESFISTDDHSTPAAAIPDSRASTPAEDIKDLMNNGSRVSTPAADIEVIANARSRASTPAVDIEEIANARSRASTPAADIEEIANARSGASTPAIDIDVNAGATATSTPAAGINFSPRKNVAMFSSSRAPSTPASGISTPCSIIGTS